MRLDGKVHGTLVKNKDGREIPEDEFVVFRPADNAFAKILDQYLTTLVIDGASAEQIDAVVKLIGRIRKWRQEHPDRCKVPDVEPGELQT